MIGRRRDGAQLNLYRDWRRKFQTETPVEYVLLTAQDEETTGCRPIKSRESAGTEQVRTKHNPTVVDVESLGNGLFLRWTQDMRRKESGSRM